MGDLMYQSACTYSQLNVSESCDLYPYKCAQVL